MAGTAAGAAKARATREARKTAAQPQDRRPKTARPAAARVRKSTPAELGLLAEVAARIEALGEATAADLPDDGSIAVAFAGEVFILRSPGDWRQSATDAMAEGRFNAWAAGVMEPDSAALFKELDLTNRQCNEFANAYQAAFTARYGDNPLELRKFLGL